MPHPCQAYTVFDMTSYLFGTELAFRMGSTSIGLWEGLQLTR